MKFKQNEYVYFKYDDVEYLEYIVTDFRPTATSFVYILYDYVTKNHKEISEENLFSADEIKFKPAKDQMVVDFLEFCPYLQ